MTQPSQAFVKPAPAQSLPHPDAVVLLMSDHTDMKALFERYAGLVRQGAADEHKRTLADTICWMLTVHITAKEEVFYPAAADAMDAQHLLHEAAVEHHSARHLIADIVNMTPAEPRFDATVKVLGGHVDHLAREEERELFPRVRQSGLDLGAVGERIATRKQEIMAEVEPAEA